LTEIRHLLLLRPHQEGRGQRADIKEGGGVIILVGNNLLALFFLLSGNIILYPIITLLS
jgi:hypothetical protein